MATVTLKGNPVTIGGNLPATGQTAPDFQLADAKRNLLSLADFAGKRKVLNIFPASTRQPAQLRYALSTSVRAASTTPSCSVFQPTCRSHKAVSAVPKVSKTSSPFPLSATPPNSRGITA